uniref:Transducin-like enhancer protein 6 n=1 Tax=Camelus bactrianus TaxID=9837 RepID=A0A9W3F5J6_CAMBA|nr:LOW QUALITY PROTEIN: transducin-like enhancer protein 6 [Camelus bactrianus]
MPEDDLLGPSQPHKESPQRMVHPEASLPEASLPAQSYLDALQQLQQQFPRFPTHLMTQMESACCSVSPAPSRAAPSRAALQELLGKAALFGLRSQFQKIRQGLQEHHKQHQGSQVSSGEQASQGSQGPASPEASRHAGVRTLQPSSLQGPNFEDTMAARSSDWLQQPPGMDDEADLELDVRLSWDSEPRLWQDVLTEELWRTFAGTREKEKRPGLRTTGQAPGLESQNPGPRRLGVEVLNEDTLVLSLPKPSPSNCEGSKEESTGWGAVGRGVSSHAAQEAAGRADQFLKPICWDPEDFESTSNRPDALPWQPKKLAVPHRVEKKRRLEHGDPVLATAVSSFTRHAFTCGRGGVKVWSLVKQVVVAWYPECYQAPLPQIPGAYLRTCLLFSNSTALLTGGHNLAGVSLWDLMAPSLYVRAELPCAGLSCQALAASPEDCLAFAGFTNGTVRIWDLRNQSVVRDLPGCLNGAKSIAVKDQNIWTGGLDACLRCWDLRTTRDPQEYPFEAQIMSLSASPKEDWVLVGTANGRQWLQPTRGGQKRMVGCKDGTILGLKFSPLGHWWVSVGTDGLVSIYSMPTGTSVVQVPETSSITCCDVSASNHLMVTGFRDHAVVYQIAY